MALALNRIHPTKSVTTVSRRNLRLTSLRCQALAGEKRVYVGKRGRSHGGVAGRNTNCVKCLIEVTEDSFEDEVIKSTVPVLVDFWADWCGPCKLITPIVDWAEKEFGGALKVVKVETDGNPSLVEKFKVHGLPTLILIRDGELVEDSRHEGAITKQFLQSYLEKRGVVPVKA